VVKLNESPSAAPTSETLGVSDVFQYFVFQNSFLRLVMKMVRKMGKKHTASEAEHRLGDAEDIEFSDPR
jgi:hypothetical protein